MYYNFYYEYRVYFFGDNTSKFWNVNKEKSRRFGEDLIQKLIVHKFYSEYKKMYYFLLVVLKNLAGQKIHNFTIILLSNVYPK